MANAPALFGADLALDRSDESVHRLSAALTTDRRDRWAARGAPGTADNALFNVVVHGAAYVGACVVASHGGVWSVRRPLWESLVRLKSRAGEADLAIFHWWLKSLADDAMGAPGEAVATAAADSGWTGGATLADRYRAHVEVPCMRPEDLPAFVAGPAIAPAPAPAALRPLAQVPPRAPARAARPGRDFPAPESIHRVRVQWLDFLVLGGGRMVLMAGASPAGAAPLLAGFARLREERFFACDAFPDPVVRVEGDRDPRDDERPGRDARARDALVGSVARALASSTAPVRTELALASGARAPPADAEVVARVTDGELGGDGRLRRGPCGAGGLADTVTARGHGSASGPQSIASARVIQGSGSSDTTWISPEGQRQPPAMPSRTTTSRAPWRRLPGPSAGSAAGERRRRPRRTPSGAAPPSRARRPPPSAVAPAGAAPRPCGGGGSRTTDLPPRPGATRAAGRRRDSRASMAMGVPGAPKAT